MTKLLVYCSYPIYDRSEEPPWVELLSKALATLKQDALVLYRSGLILSSQTDVHPLLLSEPHPFFKEYADVLGLPKLILEPITSPDVQLFLKKTEGNIPHNRVIYRNLFCLLRSHIVLCDMSSTNFGETFQDAFYANLAQIPVVGLTDKFVNSPIITERVDAIISSSKIDVILRQLIGYTLGYTESTETKSGDLSNTPDSSVGQETDNHGTEKPG